MDRNELTSRPSGIGLRHPHVPEMLQRRPLVGFLEVHAENYMHNGPQVEDLEMLGADYPLSLHSVGLSLASADGVSQTHLRALRRQVERLRPALVSAHLAWSACEGVYLNDLLPPPYNAEALALVSDSIARCQDVLGRRLLIENISAYLVLEGTTMSEAELLAEVVRRTGCGLLLDVNNVYVSAHNLEFVALDYMRQLPQDAIGQFHLAGHARNETPAGPVLIDDHGSQVPDPVWALYREALSLFGHHPTLIEWDTDIPSLDVLTSEARKADDAIGLVTSGGDHAIAA